MTVGSERVSQCPVCGARERTLLFHALTDEVLGAAPGTWDLQQCSACEAGYLDPRPDAETLALAYRGYHTHGGPESGAEPPATGRIGRLRRAIGNGYRNARYGTKRTPSTRVGALVTPLIPGFRRNIDVVFRHLPKAWPGARLLDVGFGSGSFLVAAREMGWQVAGVDTDPEVIGSARAAGLDVRQGGIEAFSDGASHESFDVITLSHVIEHVPDPIDVLTRAHALLRPGGRLWLAAPNLDSFGRRWFGRHWRGLEAPRHLVLFGPKAMETALRRSGFRNVTHLPRPDASANMFSVSRELRTRHARTANAFTARGDAKLSPLFTAAATLQPAHAEFLTLIARKE